MVSDSVNVSLSSAPSARDFGKKKRTNRTAKLKQCKLDARREQWLSQGSVKDKGFKDGTNRACMPLVGRERNPPLDALEMRRRGHGIEDNHGSIHLESDSESPSNSPKSILLGGTNSGTNFTGSSSSSSGGCCSGNITEEEENDDDGCLDDWEAVADALVASDNQESRNSCQEQPLEDEPVEQLNSKSSTGVCLGVENLKQEGPRMVPKNPMDNRAWRPDDAFRPQSLPNLLKQQSFPNTDRHFRRGQLPWTCSSAVSVPSSCPICCEALDLTDSSFFPCVCGFMLCLFCHKKILEGDGRCPGCRKPYEHNAMEAELSVHGHSLTLRLACSSSMVERS
ncbi:uncharacterized protein LOC119980396 isoform X2 [Tripterygium wilfordii]|uniref:uncharacterized protein LOC119980396 isoform X2 n=1 Tax=Tripterygium wilfordii TaxID=458696 RepID=UPI0018F7ECA1|nr:uncharacterized protein LOC119980396 isoform X2 [Tripterygium wilfordii]